MQVGNDFDASSQVGQVGEGSYEVEFVCVNERATCVGDSFRWALVAALVVKP